MPRKLRVALLPAFILPVLAPSLTAATSTRASDHDPVRVGLLQTADLAITKVAASDPVTAGTDLTYTITVTNNGPDAAASASWSDTLPAGTTFVTLPAVAGWTCTTPGVGRRGTVSCSNPSFGVGSAVFTLTVAVAPSVAVDTVLANTAAVTSATNEGSPGDESAQALTTVATAADLTVTKVESLDPVAPGGTLTWRITLVNNGPSFAADVSLVDVLPAGTAFSRVFAPAGWNCTTPVPGTGGTVTCTSSTLGRDATILLLADVDAGVATGTQLTNAATVTSSTDESLPGNETGTATTTVAFPVLAGTKAVSGMLLPGGVVTYTVVVTNISTSLHPDNTGPELLDVLPPQLRLISAIATSGTVTANPIEGTVTWDGGLEPGASVKITIQALIDTRISGMVINQGRLSFDVDGDGQNEGTAVTDDPAAGGANDPTIFRLQFGRIVEVPALDSLGLALFAMLLALGSLALLRR